MPSSIRYEPGAVVAVRIRFSNAEGTKRRPAVILTDDIYHAAHADAIVVALTTNLGPHRFGDYLLADWAAAGLPLPSKAKGSLHTIERRTIEKQYGSLTGADLTQLRASIKLVLGL